MTSPFGLFPVDDPDVQYNLDRLVSLLIDTGGRTIKLRFGNDLVTWPGAANASNATTVSHGLGGTPAQVYVSSRGGAHYCALEANDTGWTSTQFTVQGYAVDGVPGAGQQTRFSWWAIG